MQRRTFLSLVATAAGSLAGLVVGLPLVGHLLLPLRRPRSAEAETWLPLGPIAEFEDGVPERAALSVSAKDGWEVATSSHAAWVVRKGDSATVFTSVCPHLGCSVKWRAEATQFECPCHASGFALDGERRKGPARRGLDPLPSRVVAGILEVRWVEFVANVAERREVG